jgi:hypothetical protein
MTTMRKLIAGLAAFAAAGVVGVTALAPSAHASYGADTFLWRTCDSHAGVVVGTPTSCPFAHNVANAYLYGVGDLTNIWSPVTRQFYDMSDCESGHVAHMSYGGTKIVTLCQGGNDANVIVY